jgi:hypothetical protein
MCGGCGIHGCLRPFGADKRSLVPRKSQIRLPLMHVRFRVLVFSVCSSSVLSSRLYLHTAASALLLGGSNLRPPYRNLVVLSWAV